MTAAATSFWKWLGLRGGAKEDAKASATTGGSVSTEPVVVWEAANPLEAHIVKGRLISEGIPAVLQGEVLGTVYGLTTGSLAATRVMVPGPLAEKALTILHSETPWLEDEESEEESEADGPDSAE